jgi:succinyl-diaminopimelate desuccinylase
LLAHNSVLEEPGEQNKPFGPAIAAALECFLKMADDMGFKTRNVDGYMGEVDYGSGGKKIGIIAHIDIVPAGEDWTYPPFAGQIVDGKMYGRGTIDDKGPLVASLYALKAIKDSGLPCSNHVRLLVGCDEESGFRCIKHYLTVEEQPWGGFSPDGEFPVIFGEKGIFRFRCDGNWTKSASNEHFSIIEITGGSRLNVVPEVAVAILKAKDKLHALTRQLLMDNNVEARLKLESEGDVLKIKAQGVSAHSAMPWQGLNAINLLLNFLSKLPLEPVGAREFIYALTSLFTDGYEGDNLGVACSNETFGQLTLSFAMLDVDAEKGSASFDLRYPNLDERESLWQKISATCKAKGLELTLLHDKPGLYIPKESEMVQCLLKAYQDTTGRKEEPITIGGGTYSRALTNFVAYGPLFPGQKELAHEKDEYISVEDLILCTKIYTQALYGLLK